MPAPQQPNQSDNSMSLLWIIATCFVAGGLVWYAFKNAIISFYFHVKLYEIYLLSFFTHRLDDTHAAILAILNSDQKQDVPLEKVLQLGGAVGDYLSYPFGLLLTILAVLIFFSSSTRLFKRLYSMHELAQKEKKIWPQITPVVNLNLIKVDIDKGPWAMALTPMQFCKRHQLFEEYQRPYHEGMSRKEMGRIDVRLKRGQANKIFSLQLGPLWPGTQRLPPHIKALFAVFAARLNGDSQAAANLLTAINLSVSQKLNFSGADALYKKHENTKLVQPILQNHAYLLTIMAEILSAARLDGVQATADFLWLKAIDRRLWYMLNTVGRQTPFVEVAGPFAHWIAEKEVGRKILVPMIEEATNALELALKDILYKPEEAQ